MKERIENLISEMTLDEKIGQLTQEFTSVSRLDELEGLAEKGEIGSLILAATPLAGDCEQEQFFLSRLNDIQKAAAEKSRLGIPIIFGRDIIHGSKTIFPIPLAQAATWDYTLIKEAAEIMAHEASGEGVNWTFAPMLDICCDPRWGRVIECPGEDPVLGGMYARASVDGIQGDDVSKKGKLAACAKHYIGYGASQGGRDKDPAEWSDYSLRNRALPAFREAVDAGIATVMSAFNEIGGQPATSSRYHLTDILRGELGFKGFVISDWDAILRLPLQGVSDNDEDSASLAINAGVDMDMADCVYKNNLKSAIENGKVSMDTVDEAVRRILSVKFRLGLFENPYAENTEIMTPEYLEKAREVASHSMVLLKNNGVLPLKKGERVSLRGPMSQSRQDLLGSWYAGGRASDVVNFAEAINRVNGSVVLPSDAIDGAGRFMDSADVCIVALGEDKNITGEGKTMADIEISDEQINYAKTAKEYGKKVVAVIFAGRPLAITELLPYCDAVLWAWHGGTMCALAATDILFGDFNPCGKLPITFPRSTGQIPIHYNHNRNEYITSGYYADHQYVATNSPSTPGFVFGYGLSYTDFEYSDFEITKNESSVLIDFKIKNVGEHDGWEIAQCYVCDITASASRPVKELKSFKKVFVKKGETESVRLELNRRDLSFYDLRGNFVFEEGKFRIEIGKNCRDICFEQTEYISFLGEL